MTNHFRAKPPGRDTRAAAYENFMGLDTSRSRVTQDTGSGQVLATLSGGFCDEFGQIVRDPGYYRLAKSDGSAINDFIRHLSFFSEGEMSWAYKVRAGLGFDSIRNHRTDPVWPANARPSATFFNGRSVYVARGLTPWVYDGYIWREADTESKLPEYRPSFVTTVVNRAVIAGIPLKSTELHFSATDELRFYDKAVDAADETVTRPGFIDIQNLITRAEKITGIAPFEQTRLAVFTQDRMILYNTHANLEMWAIDTTANINVGCLSHNTIQPAGTDLLFCSRTGVHSVQRSRDNGILVFSMAMSDRIKRLYRRLVRGVDDPQDISAVWDQDAGQYHIFFPQRGTVFTSRLTLTMNPFADRAAPKWSLTQFLNETCADFLGGSTVYGTAQGLYRTADIEDEDAELYGPLKFSTPMLWHGDVVQKKTTASILLQAEGKGTINVRAINDADKVIWSTSVRISGDQDDGSAANTPLSDQYDRLFEAEYRGVRFEFEIVEGKGLLIVSGFAVYIKAN